ncbi:emerin-like isoform X2 [Trichomycterus rosablanca]|uniref:emerin-like isoform X2 n=1 Tax=Trichomycterus rosablanca TaxID=2290929 RepID=UPI002F35304F
MLRSKSDEELGWMLDDYGIKHGPVVGSTRALYERKLRDVMAKERKIKAPAERSFCREEEMIYTNHSKTNKLTRERAEYRGVSANRFYTRDEDDDDDPIRYQLQDLSASPGRHSAHQYSPMKPQIKPAPSSERAAPLWLQILLFIIVVLIMALIFIYMEPSVTQPFKRLT